MSVLAGDFGTISLGERLAANNCAWCHGVSAQGYTTAPRLAGQTRQYLEEQLFVFKNHSRDNPLSKLHMWGATSPLSPQAVHELSVYFSALNAVPAEDGDKGLFSSGQALYEEGVPDANIPSCIACHGPKAEGAGPFPRLSGLSYYYLKRRLEQWGEGFDLAARHPMPGIARQLSANEIEALASYLSFVK
jgi:cytochrome c553